MIFQEFLIFPQKNENVGGVEFLPGRTPLGMFPGPWAPRGCPPPPPTHLQVLTPPTSHFIQIHLEGWMPFASFGEPMGALPEPTGSPMPTSPGFTPSLPGFLGDLPRLPKFSTLDLQGHRRGGKSQPQKWGWGSVALVLWGEVLCQKFLLAPKEEP